MIAQPHELTRLGALVEPVTATTGNWSTKSTDEFVLKIIISASAKSCKLDPIPTTLLYENLNILLPPRTSSIHLLPPTLYHVIWRLLSSNLYWKSHHLTKSFEKLPSQSFKKSFSTNFSPISREKTTTQQTLSVSLSSRTQHRDSFVMYCKRYIFPLWTITTLLFFFCWIFLLLLTLLTTKFSSPAWTLFFFFFFSLLHSV